METWEPSEHSLVDTRKPRKTCAEVAGRSFRILISSQQSGICGRLWGFNTVSANNIISFRENISYYTIQQDKTRFDEVFEIIRSSVTSCHNDICSVAYALLSYTSVFILLDLLRIMRFVTGHETKYEGATF